MRSVLELIGLSVLLPAGVAIATFWVIRRSLADDVAVRYASAVCLVAGFAAGYFLLDGAQWRPGRHWHWIPYVGVAAAIATPIGLASGVRRVERWLLYLFLAFLTAWFLVPDWDTLQPKRSLLIPLLGGYLGALMLFLDLLPRETVGKRVPGFLAMATGLMAAGIAAAVSLRYAQLALLLTASLVGCWLAVTYKGTEDLIPSLMAPFALLAGSIAFVACIEPEEALYELLVVPASPLMLWCFAWGPARRLRRVPLIAAQGIAVALPSIFAIAVLALRE